MRPRLIGPETLTIHPRNPAATITDGYTGDSVGQLARLPVVEVKAQVDELRDNTRTATQGGAEIPVLWTVTFRRIDLARAGYSPRNGDLVTARADRYGTRPVCLYVVNATDSGEIGTGRSLVEADLTDLAPARWAVEGL